MKNGIGWVFGIAGVVCALFFAGFSSYMLSDFAYHLILYSLKMRNSIDYRSLAGTIGGAIMFLFSFGIFAIGVELADDF